MSRDHQFGRLLSRRGGKSEQHVDGFAIILNVCTVLDYIQLLVIVAPRVRSIRNRMTHRQRPCSNSKTKHGKAVDRVESHRGFYETRYAPGYFCAGSISERC